VQNFVRTAQHLADTRDPGEAFLGYFAFLVEQAAAERGTAAAPARDGVDAAARGGEDLAGLERALLKGAQLAGTIRPDVTRADVEALVAACAARDTATGRRRMVDIVLTGLAPPP
jgi:hypothetical protein